jgi:hypothetical protein
LNLITKLAPDVGLFGGLRLMLESVEEGLSESDMMNFLQFELRICGHSMSSMVSVFDSSL